MRPIRFSNSDRAYSIVDRERPRPRNVSLVFYNQHVSFFLFFSLGSFSCSLENPRNTGNTLCSARDQKSRKIKDSSESLRALLGEIVFFERRRADHDQGREQRRTNARTSGAKERKEFERNPRFLAFLGFRFRFSSFSPLSLSRV